VSRIKWFSCVTHRLEPGIMADIMWPTSWRHHGGIVWRHDDSWWAYVDSLRLAAGPYGRDRIPPA
jgi:hypothetical protein